MLVSLVCFSNQFESFLHLLGLHKKLFSFGFHNEQVEHGISALLFILNRSYVMHSNQFITCESRLMVNHNYSKYDQRWLNYTLLAT